MTGWVNAVGGVVAGVGIAVVGLGVAGVGDKGVGGDEAGEGGVVVAGVVVDETQIVVVVLTREAGVGDGLGGGGAVGAEGLVAGIGTGEFAAGAFGQVAGAAEVVGVKVEVAVVGGYGVAGDVDGYVSQGYCVWVNRSSYYFMRNRKQLKKIGFCFPTEQNTTFPSFGI